MKRGLSAKTKSAETVVKNVADSKSKTTTGRSRTDLTAIKASPPHPWYYVKGRRDLTEKNISSRREREEQRYRQSLFNSQYFDKQSAETQMFRNWTDNKTLVRHSKSVPILRPPYDVFDEPKVDPRSKFKTDKDSAKKCFKALQKLKEFVKKFKEMDEKYIQLETKQNILVLQVKEMRLIETSFEEKKLFYELLSKGLNNIRFCGDKLKRKVFQIIDQLNHYKTLVKKIDLLKDCKTIMTEEETKALTEVVDRGIKILNMYISLNEKRNKESQLLYDEEANSRWESQDKEWQTEYEIWTLMTEKLIVSYTNVIKDKLNHILSEESSALDERQQVLKELTDLSAKIKADSQIAWLLTENIEDLIVETENTKPESKTNGT